MFVPKSQMGNQSPTGASASPEAVQLAMITRYIESLNSPTNAVAIPFLTAIGSGIQIMFEIGALYLIYHYPNSIFSWMLFGMITTVIIIWVILVSSRRRSLNNLEYGLNRDLNGDGFIGKKPIREIKSKIETPTGYHYEHWQGLDADTVEASSRIIQANGYRVNQILLTGEGRPLSKANSKIEGGRGTYDIFIDILTDAANAWGAKTNPNNPNSGVALTPAGIKQIDLICEDDENE